MTINDATIILLGIVTIRQLIAQNFDVPLPSKYRWLLYNKKDSSDLVMCRQAHMINQLIDQDKKGSSSSIVEKLLELDSRHIKYFSDGLMHGRSTTVQSKYFINTLEASYNEDDLSIMTTALRHLINNSSLHMNQVDFLLYIKSGNQILARNIYKPVDRNMIYVCRRDDNSSSYPINAKAEANMFSVQFENLETLLRAAKQSKSGKLTGIAVDCSISTGTGLKDAIHHFNELIDRDNLNINKIEHAYVLYAHKPFSDDNCKEFKLHRYFDMDEEVRKLIYEVHEGKQNIGCIEVYNYLKEKDYLRSGHS